MLNPLAPFRIALRERNLRLLLGGLATSQAGDWLYNLALLAFVYERTHSSMWVGLTTAVRIVPEVALGSLGGVLADRVDRRVLMLGSDAVRALTMVALALVAVTHAPVVLAPALAALSTAAGSAYPPCVVAILPRLVSEDQLPAANAARVSVTFICVVAGPVFGAVLLLLGSPALAFAVNGATFALGGLVVSALPRDAFRRSAAAASDQPLGLVRELQVGWSALRGYRDGVAVVGANIVASAVYGAMTVLLVLFAQRAGAGTAGYGYLLAAAGLGAVLSAGLAQRAATGDRARRVLSISLLAVGAPLPLVALSGSLPAAAVLVAVIGAGSIVTEVVGDTCLQRALDPAVFARAYGLAIPAYVAGIAVGALLTPVFVEAFGLTATFVGLGLAVVAYGGFIAAGAAGADGGKARSVRLAPRARRAGAAAALALSLALAGATVASADTPAPGTPVHVDAAGVARLLFVAGDVERLTQVPSGTESIVLEKVLQELYAANPTLPSSQAVSDIQSLQAALGSGSPAISPATLTAMGGNARILAILTALTDSSPTGEVRHALAQVTDHALSDASRSPASGGQSFDPSADSLSTLTYSSFSPAETLAATASLAATNHPFGQARDALWKQASHESVFDDSSTLESENPALQTDAIKSLEALVGNDGALSTTAGGLEGLLHDGITQIGDQTSSALADARTVTQQCPNGSSDTSASCLSARSHMQADGAGEIDTIRSQRASTAAEATALGSVDPALQEAENAESEAAAQVADDAEEYLQNSTVQAIVHTTFDVASIAISLGESELDPAAAVDALLSVLGDTTGYAFADPTAQILQGIQDISQQLGSFERYTSLSFEALDGGLKDLSSQILAETTDLSRQIDNLHDQVTSLSGTLSSLQDSVDRLESEVQSLFAQGAQNELATNVNTYIGFAHKNGGRSLSADQFNTAAAAFFTEATTVANSVTLTTKPQDADFTADGASRLGSGTDAGALATNINVFNYFPGAVQDAPSGLGWPDSTQDLAGACGVGASAADRVCLPNPAFWASAARAYAQLLLENPQYVTQARLDDLSTILRSGQAIAGALHRLSVNDTSAGGLGQSTGNSILDRAIAYYRDWGKQLAQVLKNDEQSYLANQHPPVYGANGSFSYTGVNPWGGVSQSPDLSTLEKTPAFTNVPLCQAFVSSQLGGSTVVDPKQFTLPRLPASVFSFLPAQVLDAERLGEGHISPCWSAAFSGWEANNGVAGQLVAEIDFYYTSRDGRVSDFVGYAQAQVFATNCTGQELSDPPPFGPPLTLIDALAGIKLVTENWPGIANPNTGCTDMSVYLSRSANQHPFYPSDVSSSVESADRDALVTLQKHVYGDVLGSDSSLTTGGPDGTNVQLAAKRLAGANALLNGYVSLGLPQALASDDTLRSLIDGDQANAFMATNTGGAVLPVAPANTIAGQVASVYDAAGQQDLSYDPASYIAEMFDNRANQLLYAIRPHIVPAAAGSGARVKASATTSAATGSSATGSSATASSATTAITAEEDALITPTLYRLTETGAVLGDAMDGGVQVTVKTAGAGSGTVSGPGVSCPGSCSHRYTPGSPATLTATPAPGSTFTGWSGGCTGTDACMVPSGLLDETVTATFAPAPAGQPQTPAGGQPAPGPAPAPAPAPHAGPPAPRCSVTATGHAVALSRSPAKKGKARQAKPGVLTLLVKCDQPARLTLSGRVRIVLSRRHVQTVSVRTTSLVGRAGHATPVAVKLPGAASKALARHARESATFTLSAVGAGGRSTTRLAIATIAARSK